MAKRSGDAAGLDDSKKVKKDKLKSKDEKSKDKKEKKEKKEKKDRKESKESKKEKSKKSKSEPTESTEPAHASPTPASVEKFLETNSVGIEVGKSIPKCTPVLTMDAVPVNDDIKKVIKEYPTPTPIQSATWPYLIQGNDVIGVAETGSGKTMAFGVPAAQRITSSKGRGVRALIISPTRELAMQIDENLAKLKSTGVSTACVYGGVPKHEQRQAIKKASIVAGTPGRLKDLIGEGALDLSNVEYLVLDEADRMLEKGFEQDIKEIIGAVTSSDRQTVMFTATWPPQVRDLAASFMKPEVVKVSIGDADELSANKRITQIVEVIDPQDKERKFIEVLQKYTRKDPKQKILVFALYKKEATRIERLLNNKGYRVAAVHGDLNQTQRTQALDDFKKGKSSLMLATDVAARGLDIPAVKVVINLTFPLTAEDYVHRIGRTGRAGQTGIAHTLFTEHEKHLSGALINVLNGANQPVPEDLLKFGSHTKKKEHSLYGAFFKDTGDKPMPKATKIKFD